MTKEYLLCDFHIHTENSDGNLSIEQVVDLYGNEGFDVIAITDHLLDRKYAEKAEKTKKEFPGIRKENLEDHIDRIKKERERAIEEYGMLVIPGIEYTNNTHGFHILGLDSEKFIEPLSSPEKIIKGIKKDGGVAIACHPADQTSKGRHEGNTYLWDHNKQLRDRFDAWEIGNRNELFSHIGENSLNYLANSDLHSERHIESWKTVLHCEKTLKGVKKAIKENRNVGIRMYQKKERCGSCKDCNC